MPYSLRRTRDGAGDSGLMSLALIPTWDMDTNMIVRMETKENARPQVGAAMRVGSHYARTMQYQDWWQTTIVTEILEERTDEEGVEYVRFKTGKSEYEWKSF